MKKRDDFLQDHPEKRQILNGRDWGVIKAGNTGPALVLLPGTLGRADIFWYQIMALKHRARIFAFSYPDSGGIEEWAQDIATFLKQNNITKSVILGSSLGGYLAQYFAIKHAGFVLSLVAANTLHSVDLVKQIPPYNQDLPNLPIKDLHAGFATGLERWAHEEPARQNIVTYLLHEVINRIPEAELKQRLIALKTAPEIPDQSNPGFPVWTIESNDDRLIPEYIRQKVREKLTPQESHFFEDGSHFPYLTYPAEYESLLIRIMDGVS